MTDHTYTPMKKQPPASVDWTFLGINSSDHAEFVGFSHALEDDVYWYAKVPKRFVCQPVRCDFGPRWSAGPKVWHWVTEAEP